MQGSRRYRPASRRPAGTRLRLTASGPSCAELAELVMQSGGHAGYGANWSVPDSASRRFAERSQIRRQLGPWDCLPLAVSPREAPATPTYYCLDISTLTGVYAVRNRKGNANRESLFNRSRWGAAGPASTRRPMKRRRAELTLQSVDTWNSAGSMGGEELGCAFRRLTQ
jgi:hypothetical protein